MYNQDTPSMAERGWCAYPGVIYAKSAAQTILVEETVLIGEGATIEPGVVLLGKTVIGKDCYIEAGARLENVFLGDGSRVLSGARIANSKIGAGSKIGAEVTDSTIGNGVKAVHRSSYLGNAVVHGGVNIAAGVVTANFDGANKKRTIIGENSFIGVGVTLVAPIKIGKNVFIPAGLEIRDDIPSGKFVKPDPNPREKPGYLLVENEMKKEGDYWIRRGPR